MIHLARVLAQAAPEGPLVLVGHSMGGMTMMSLAVDHHALIRERDPLKCFRAFLYNNWVGAAIFGGIVLAYLL